MTQRQVLLDEIKKAPDNIFQEVFDFYQFIKTKSKNTNDILIASESSLKKDWLKKDEDEAWQDL
jgi:hypothetical protein